MLAFRRILVPVDFSECSAAALDYAVRLAERVGASIQLLHVWDAPSALGPDLGDVMVQAPEGKRTLGEVVRTRAGRELDSLLASVGARTRVDVSGRLEMGDACQAILEAAGNDFDLIVMGTHGRRGISHVLMGSVAERVVRAAPCPVLTVRAGRPRAAEATS